MTSEREPKITHLDYLNWFTLLIRKTNGETIVKKNAGTHYLNKHLDKSGSVQVVVSYKTDLISAYTHSDGYNRRMENIVNYYYSGEFLPMRENGNVIPWHFTTTLIRKVNTYFSDIKQNEYLRDKYKIKKRNEKINGRRRSKKKSR
tara:strand:+ start:5031 stop:5468 length:438 start_codon:yes stop_codon:yes gene_type:complete